MRFIGTHFKCCSARSKKIILYNDKSKTNILNQWNKDIAPSKVLRKWFSHKPELFKAFSEQYKKELQEKGQRNTELKIFVALKTSLCFMQPKTQ